MTAQRSMTKASDWFSTAEEWHRLVSEAFNRAGTSKAAEEFTTRFVDKEKRHGLDTFVSEKQLMWLYNLAGQGRPPKFRNRA